MGDLNEKYDSFSNASSNIEKYLEIVKCIGVNTIGDKFLSSHKVLKSFTNYKIENNELVSVFEPKEIAAAISLLDFVENIITVHKHPDFYKLKNLITKLHNFDFQQNWYTSDLKGANLKANHELWELDFALQIYKIADTVDLESYDKSTNNPDIIAKIDHLLWGFACKVPNPEINKVNIKRFLRNLQKGIRQLENSKIEKGFVIFNGRNYINHSVFLENEFKNGKYHYKIFEDSKIPLDNFNHQILSATNTIKDTMQNMTFKDKENNPEYWRKYLGVKNSTTFEWVIFFFSISFCQFQNKIAIEKLTRPIIQGELIDYSIIVDLIWQIHAAYNDRHKVKTYNSSISLLN